MQWIRTVLLASLSLTCMDARAEDGATRMRPNILFLAVDDMRDWVNCLGGYAGKVHTPNIDRLARNGTLFTNAHCASPKCAPSRAALLTGRMPSSTGLYDNGHWWFPNWPNLTTICSHFRKHDYRVVGAGKIFHHTAGNNPPNQWHDFQRLIFKNDSWFRDVTLNYPWSKPEPFPPGFPFSGVTGLGHENDWGSLPIAEEEYDDVHAVNYVVRFLEADRAEPFFLACGLFRPHLPWYVPSNYFDLYPLEEIVLPAVKTDDLSDVPEQGRKFSEAGRGDLQKIVGSRHLRQAIQAYLASISFADAQLGRVLDALEQSSASENTMIVFWSDHGWHLGEKEHWHKSTLWEEATRVPFVIRSPTINAGVCDAPVSLIDVFPTLIELCDLETVDALDGVSLVPLLREPDAQWERPAVIEYLQGNAAVRSKYHRYVHYHDGGEELYDYRSDPNEWINLAQDPAYAAIKSELSHWLPKSWAEPAASKSAFEFNPDEFTWRSKATGQLIDGTEVP